MCVSLTHPLTTYLIILQVTEQFRISDDLWQARGVCVSGWVCVSELVRMMKVQGIE